MQPSISTQESNNLQKRVVLTRSLVYELINLGSCGVLVIPVVEMQTWVTCTNDSGSSGAMSATSADDIHRRRRR